MFNKKIVGFLSIFLILTLTLGVVCASDNTTQSLGNSTEAVDENPIENVKSFEDLEYQINCTEDNAVITIDGYYVSSGSDIYVYNKNLTIEGRPSATIDANYSSGAFTFYGEEKTVTLKNLIIKNANGPKYGGAIFSNSKIILDNCTFLNNYAQAEIVNNTIRSVGGAIYNYNSIEATNCKFINNSAMSCGVFYYEGNLKCVNTTFSKNLETLGIGLIFTDLENTLYLKDCVFSDNTAARALINCYYASVTCENVKFTNNKNAAIILDDVENAKINNKKYTGDYILTDSLATTYFAKATSASVSTTFDSGAKLKITVTDTLTKKAISGYNLIVKVYTGKSYEDYEVETNSKGVATLAVSKLSIGTHKIVITSYSEINEYNIKKVSTTVKVAKAKTTVKAPKVTNKYKKSKYFKVTIKNKASKKVVKGLKLKVKVYTGKKYKTYTIKTNKKGVAQLNTKSLKVGSHKVVISSGNAKYTVSAKSTIKIKR